MVSKLREGLVSLPLRKRIIPALDALDFEAVLRLMSRIGEDVQAVKIHNHWDEMGPDVVRQLRDAGAAQVFVDLKLHDTPDTVARRAAAVRKAGAHMLTVHAAGGIPMMRKAVEHGPPIILAITVLTSLSSVDSELTFGLSSRAAALKFARNAALAGVHGLVCSPEEVLLLASQPELDNLHLVVRGIQVQKNHGMRHDQQRVGSPREALQNGASYLVIGRQITESDEPAEALSEIVRAM